MATKKYFFRYGSFLIKDGSKIRFWEDKWLGETPLALQSPTLYNIVQSKEDYVGIVLQTIPLNIQFRRTLVGERWIAWMHLV